MTYSFSSKENVLTGETLTGETNEKMTKACIRCRALTLLPALDASTGNISFKMFVLLPRFFLSYCWSQYIQHKQINTHRIPFVQHLLGNSQLWECSCRLPPFPPSFESKLHRQGWGGSKQQKRQPALQAGDSPAHLCYPAQATLFLCLRRPSACQNYSISFFPCISTERWPGREQRWIKSKSCALDAARDEWGSSTLLLMHLCCWPLQSLFPTVEWYNSKHTHHSLKTFTFTQTAWILTTGMEAAGQRGRQEHGHCWTVTCNQMFLLFTDLKGIFPADLLVS